MEQAIVHEERQSAKRPNLFSMRGAMTFGLLIGLLACGLGACNNGPGPGPFIYVADFDSNSVTAYLLQVGGNTAPFKTYSGNNTELAGPTGPAVDFNHTLYVTNDSSAGGPSVTVYALVNGGNVSPTNIIQGPATMLSGPHAVAIDASGNIWVANYGNNSVTAYTPSGAANRAPIWTVTSGVSQPVGVAIYNPPASIGGPPILYVLNSGGGASITVYPNLGVNGAPPTQTLSGAKTLLSQPQGLAVDSGNNVWVSEYDKDAILFFAGGNQVNGDTPPWVVVNGGSTGLSGPKGLFVDSAGEVYVANGRNSSITRYSSSSFLSNGGPTGPTINVTPDQVIQGSSANLSHIIGLTVG
jgi:serine/threonine-protein kinase